VTYISDNASHPLHESKVTIPHGDYWDGSNIIISNPPNSYSFTQSQFDGTLPSHTDGGRIEIRTHYVNCDKGTGNEYQDRTNSNTFSSSTPEDASGEFITRQYVDNIIISNNNQTIVNNNSVYNKTPDDLWINYVSSETKDLLNISDEYWINHNDQYSKYCKLKMGLLHTKNIGIDGITECGDEAQRLGLSGNVQNGHNIDHYLNKLDQNYLQGISAYLQ